MTLLMLWNLVKLTSTSGREEARAERLYLLFGHDLMGSLLVSLDSKTLQTWPCMALIRARVCTCACTSVPLRIRACVLVRMRAPLHAGTPTYARAHVRACLCVRVCTYALACNHAL